jgi:hypothetical protein
VQEIYFLVAVSEILVEEIQNFREIYFYDHRYKKFIKLKILVEEIQNIRENFFCDTRYEKFIK